MEERETRCRVDTLLARLMDNIPVLGSMDEVRLTTRMWQRLRWWRRAFSS
jgi:hypothetical protein